MDTSFCVATLEEALGKGRPEIFNTDQGSQFTSEAFTQTLQEQRASRSAWMVRVGTWTTVSQHPRRHAERRKRWKCHAA